MTKLRSAIYWMVATSLTAGCATKSVMPEGKYQHFAEFVGYTQNCFERGHLSPQLYADAKNAVSHLLGTWDFDQAKMTFMMKTAYMQGSPDASTCRQIEANAYQLISVANQHKSDVKESQQQLSSAIQDFNKSMSTNKPIFCNRIGTTTMCN